MKVFLQIGNSLMENVKVFPEFGNSLMENVKVFLRIGNIWSVCSDCKSYDQGSGLQTRNSGVIRVDLVRRENLCPIKEPYQKA